MLKLRAHHSGKFAPRENNPLYGINNIRSTIYSNFYLKHYNIAIYYSH